MKFPKISRPKLKRTPPKVIRRQADVCPWCGAVESIRAYCTRRTKTAILRYGTCTRCRKPVTRMIKI